MKKLIGVILLLFIFLSCTKDIIEPPGKVETDLVSSNKKNMTTWYISTTGSDVLGTGTVTNPWKSLFYACTSVGTSGDIIYVNPGTYIEIQQCILAPGVSILGAGNTSIIKSHYYLAEYGWLIQVYTAGEGNPGNQSISYVKLDGDNYQGYGAIEVMGRNNVTVHHCTIVNFYAGAVFVAGTDGKPTSTYASGCSVHDCTITDCATCEGGGWQLYAAISNGGTIGFQIYNNTIYQPDRGANITGEALKQAKGGFVYGTKIYNNSIIVDPSPGSVANGIGEFFDCLGGIEIYGNTMAGTLDFSCNILGDYGEVNALSLQDIGGYGFALKVHDNHFIYSVYRDDYASAIDIERNCTGGVYIYDNYFENLGTAIQFSYNVGDGGTGSYYVKQDVYIYYNIFYDIGKPSDTYYGSAINVETGSLSSNDEVLNFYVFNNVFRAGSLAYPRGAITTYNGGKWNNTYIRNNIFTEWPYPIELVNVAVTTMSIENNIFYGNSSNAPYFSGGSRAGLTQQNNLTSNPLYVGGSPYSYRLSVGSPAISAGIHMSSTPYITTDYGEVNSIQNPPSIGVYEFSGVVAQVSVMGKINKFSIGN